MNRTSIINSLIQKTAASRYLEIGVRDGENFDQIACAYKVGVDPDPNSSATLHITSDEFFKSNKEKFDVIFIDGLHHADQVEKDIENSLSVLTDKGYIVCHDMNPLEERCQTIPYNGQGRWNGDCWKAFVKFRQSRSDLSMAVVETDEGCGIISRGSQTPIVITDDINYQNFSLKKNEWLNLISIDEFRQKYTNEVPLKTLINQFVLDPDNPDHNFNLALYYHGIGQTASAVSYYIRTAERTTDTLLRYECLLRASKCFDEQGTRGFSVKGLLQHAIALMPTRPEGYFLLSRYYENEKAEGSWFNCYMIASVGLEVCNFDLPNLRTDVGYPGKYGIIFEKAVSSWWCGLCSESKELFKDLLINYELDNAHRTAVINNLKHLNALNSTVLTLFDESKHPDLKVKFPGSESIIQNYSEAYQDMFILSMLNGKRNGTYLEIGAGNPYYGNNTALLEKSFGWTGVSLDIDPQFVEAFAKERKNPCILKDASLVDYDKFLSGLGFSNNIDYLQLDCDPPSVTYKILTTIPFEKYKFAVITYEHDYYCDDTKSFREKSRRYLESFGYVMVVGDIAPDDWRTYEDWWVHPDLVDQNTIQKMKNTSKSTKCAENYLLGKLHD